MTTSEGASEPLAVVSLGPGPAADACGRQRVKQAVGLAQAHGNRVGARPLTRGAKRDHHDVLRFRDHAAGSAAGRVIERLAAAGVREYAARLTVIGGVRLAPGAEGVQGRPQRLPFGRYLIEMAAAMAGVRPAFKQASVDQCGQPRAQHGARRVEVSGEVVEAADPVEGVTHDEQRPALTDQLKRTRQRAVLILVGTGQHTAMKPRKPA